MNIRKLYQDNRHAFQTVGFSCGPVTLLNILRQRGDMSHTEEELIELCKADAVTGTTNDNLITAARTLGFTIVEERDKATVKDIERQLDEDNMVVVNYFYAFSNEGHYAQVAEYDDKAFYLIDPTAGYMRIKKEYFVTNWHSQDGTITGWFMAIRRP